MRVFKKYISLFIVAVTALQIINLGLYAQGFDVLPQDKGKQLNIINSVTEYVAEGLMNKPDAFPEKKEKPNQKEHDSNFKFQPFKIAFNKALRYSQMASCKARTYGTFVAGHYSNHTTDIVSPPPKFVC